ncbi:MAG: TolC family protein [bacterium]
MGFLVIFIHSFTYAAQLDEYDFLSGAPTLTLEELLTRGLEENLDVKMEKVQIPIEKEDVEFYRAEFDPALESSLNIDERKNPVSSSLTSGGFNITRTRQGEIGLLKRFPTGLESRIAINSSRSTNNSRVDGLRPQYRSQLVLNLLQPLLRDFGTEVNTTNIQLSENEVQQAFYSYQEQAMSVAEDIEILYYDLAEALALYQFRLESLELAQQLREGNQMKFEAGLAPINEVQEAETAIASRRELVILAKQEVELTLNRIRDIIDASPTDTLFTHPFVTSPIVENEFPVTLPLEDALNLAFRHRPDLKRIQNEIRNWDIRLLYYKNQKLPRLDLQATLGLNGLSGKSRSIPDLGDEFAPTNPHVGSYFDSFGHLVEGDGLEWFIGVQVSYPLGNRAAEARYRQTDLQKIRSIMRLKQLENAIETEIEEAITIIQRSWERVTVTQQFQELADRSLEQENTRFTEGLSDTFRLLDFQDDVIDARIRKINALTDYHQGLASFYRALGINLNRYNIELTMDTEVTDVEETDTTP